MMRVKTGTVMRWCVQDEASQGGEWTEWGWRNEAGSWFHRYGDSYRKEQLVILIPTVGYYINSAVWS